MEGGGHPGLRHAHPHRVVNGRRRASLGERSKRLRRPQPRLRSNLKNMPRIKRKRAKCEGRRHPYITVSVRPDGGVARRPPDGRAEELMEQNGPRRVQVVTQGVPPEILSVLHMLGKLLH